MGSHFQPRSESFLQLITNILDRKQIKKLSRDLSPRARWIYVLGTELHHEKQRHARNSILFKEIVASIQKCPRTFHCSSSKRVKNCAMVDSGLLEDLCVTAGWNVIAPCGTCATRSPMTRQHVREHVVYFFEGPVIPFGATVSYKPIVFQR